MVLWYSVYSIIVDHKENLMKGKHIKNGTKEASLKIQD